MTYQAKLTAQFASERFWLTSSVTWATILQFQCLDQTGTRDV